jgi:hypothetical protein
MGPSTIVLKNQAKYKTYSELLWEKIQADAKKGKK